MRGDRRSGDSPLPAVRLAAQEGQEIELVPHQSGDEHGPSDGRRPSYTSRRWRRRALVSMVRLALVAIMLVLIALIAAFTTDNGGMLRYVFRPGRTLWREDLHASRYPRARCNDGSEGAYYFSEALTEALKPGEQVASNWLIMLEGGFQCYSADSCACRARNSPNLMSSVRWPASMKAEGVSEQLPGWNVAVVKYCSSDAWLGDGSVQMPISGALANSSFNAPLRFGGRAILEGTLRQLTLSHGMADARRVIIGGCSAGGRGAFYNLDHACELVRMIARGSQLAEAEDAGPRCEGLIDAGWWHDVEPTAEQRQRGVPSFREISSASFALYGPSAAKQLASEDASAAGAGGVCGQCASDALQHRKDPGGCLLGAACAAYTRTPFFLVQSQYDSFALSVLLGALPPAKATLDSALAEWLTNGKLARVAGAQRDLSRAVWLGRFEGSQAKRSGLTGLFASACYTHCSTSSSSWFRTTVNGRSASAVFADWLESGTALAIDDCTNEVAGGIGCSGECAYSSIWNACTCEAPRLRGNFSGTPALCPWSLKS